MRSNKSFVCYLVLSFLSLMPVQSLAEESSPALAHSSLHAPQLSAEFLRAPPIRAVRPSLRVKFYNPKQGLYAGYESPNGKRILFRAKSLPNGVVLAAAFHLVAKRNPRAVHVVIA